MPFQSWFCDKCGSRFDTKEKAEECEEAHTTDISKWKIDVVSFHESYRCFRFMLEGGPIPSTPKMIRIQLSDDRSDFATYVMKDYGPRGV